MLAVACPLAHGSNSTELKHLTAFSMQQHPKTFAHYDTANGKIGSICLACYLTVAISCDEAEVQANEAQHDCRTDPFIVKITRPRDTPNKDIYSCCREVETSKEA